MGYTFEWDPEKADASLQKHAVSFDEASTVFGDPLSLLIPDPDHSADEERHLAPGMSDGLGVNQALRALAPVLREQRQSR